MHEVSGNASMGYNCTGQMHVTIATRSLYYLNECSQHDYIQYRTFLHISVPIVEYFMHISRLLLLFGHSVNLLEQRGMKP